jgi:ADP-ribosyl-[dinitrogen reductase] hydrolase
VTLAALTVNGGDPDAKGWPSIGFAPYSERAASVDVPHPYDDGLLLGTHASRGHDVDAVVSMCRVRRDQECFCASNRAHPLSAHGQ